MPPPSKLKRKILIKNKRLKTEVEKEELEKYLKGQLEIGEEESEDTSNAPPPGEGAEGAPAQPAHRYGFPAQKITYGFLQRTYRHGQMTTYVY